MKKLLFLFLFFGWSQFADAAFNTQRDTVGKSSYTESSDINVKLSSAPSFVRSITFSGATPSTVTIYNAREFNPAVSTRTKVYWPGNQVVPVTVYVDVINSSGTMYHKIGAAHATFNWDWYAKPDYASPLNEGN